MCDALHQGLQIGMQFLRSSQVILRASEKCTDFRPRSRRHGVDSVSATSASSTRVKYVWLG